MVLAVNSLAGYEFRPSELFAVRKTATVIEAFRQRPNSTGTILQHHPHKTAIGLLHRNIGDHRELRCRSPPHLMATIGPIWAKPWTRPKGSWDESGTIAPYVVANEGKIYLFTRLLRE